MSYTIDKARSRDDYDNMCLQPSDGGKYSAADAVRILENGNGGSMQHVKTGKGYMVSYDKASNLWLYKKLKLNYGKKV